jgi:hypothetical protein
MDYIIPQHLISDLTVQEPEENTFAEKVVEIAIFERVIETSSSFFVKHAFRQRLLTT